MSLYIIAVIMAVLFTALVVILLWALGVLEIDLKRVEGDEQ